MNAGKTKAMVTKGQVDTINQSTAAYVRCMTGVGATYREREKAIVTCYICSANMQRRSLRNHIRFGHPDEYMVSQQLTAPEESEPGPDPEADHGLFFCSMAPGNHALANCPIPSCSQPLK